LFTERLKLLVVAAACATICAADSKLSAQENSVLGEGAAQRSSTAAPNASGRRLAQRSATIHWQRVPLRDAIGRLHALFHEPVFVDRRVDPGLRVSLDIEATLAEEVVAAIAAGNDLAVARLSTLVYLGPTAAADQLRAIAVARSQEAAKLPAAVRSVVLQKRRIGWQRLSKPRDLLASAVEQRGWRLAEGEKIPHDLWAAGELPELSLSDQLTVLLIGFDLTFAFRSSDRTIEIVPLKGAIKPDASTTANKRRAAPANAERAKNGSRQVYTLRVTEQPVRAILQALSNRLHWAIQIDEDAIRAAGKSLDQRVSFSLENADQQHLLEAILKPAGLDYRLEDDRVRIIPRRYGDK
jgi:hypothetical protein